MSVKSGVLKNAITALRRYCDNTKCDNCEIKGHCTDGFIHYPYSFDDVVPATLVLGCADKNVCSEYILMKAELTEKISTLEEQNKTLKNQLSFVTATRDALEKKLEECCPDWRARKDA